MFIDDVFKGLLNLLIIAFTNSLITLSWIVREIFRSNILKINEFFFNAHVTLKQKFYEKNIETFCQTNRKRKEQMWPKN